MTKKAVKQKEAPTADCHGRPVKASDMRAWRAEMGLSERDACDRLGISRNSLRTCEREGAPLYIGLACAAVLADMPPYKKGS